MNRPAIALPSEPADLVTLFEAAVERHRRRPLFGTKDPASGRYRWVDYQTVGRRVDALRAGLAGLGVGPGDAVAIIAGNRVEWAVAAYASYGRRARFVPMYEAELPRIWAYIIADAGCKVLLVANPELRQRVADLTERIDCLEHIVTIDGDGPDSLAALEARGATAPSPPLRPRPDEVAGLIYTSGTTGRPKGVLLSHRNLTSNVLGIYAAKPGDLGRDDRTLSFLPWAHSFGQTAELHLLVHAGASTGFAEKPTTIIDDILQLRPTILVGVPRVFNKIHAGVCGRMAARGGPAARLFHAGLAAAERLRQGRGRLLDRPLRALADRLLFARVRARFGGRLKLAISSSAALQREVLEFFWNLGLPVYEAWGMTELSPAHTLNLPHDYKLGSAGRPLPGCRIEIDAQAVAQADPGADDGEVIAYGPNVMLGYHGRPAETAAVLRPDGGLRTGDRGRLDADGFLVLTGRIKEQFKLQNGKYVFPAGIEQRIKLSPYVDNCMLVGADRPYSAVVVAPDFDALAPWAAERGLPADPQALAGAPELERLLAAEIAARCADCAKYEVPRRLLLVAEPFSPDSGILTPTLKLKRRAVLDRWADRIEALYDAAG